MLSQQAHVAQNNIAPTGETGRNLFEVRSEGDRSTKRGTYRKTFGFKATTTGAFIATLLVIGADAGGVRSQMLGTVKTETAGDGGGTRGDRSRNGRSSSGSGSRHGGVVDGNGCLKRDLEDLTVYIRLA